MNKEDKKALESVKDMFSEVTMKDIDEQKITIYGAAMLDVIRVLTIVEKQQKEIEELNLKNIELKQSKIVDKNSIPNQDNFYDCYNYISKDKIKAKIEELNKKSFKNDINYSEFYYKKEVLQSLLEKE